MMSNSKMRIINVLCTQHKSSIIKYEVNSATCHYALVKEKCLLISLTNHQSHQHVTVNGVLLIAVDFIELGYN